MSRVVTIRKKGSKKKQEPIFMVSIMDNDDNKVKFGYFTNSYEEEYEDEGGLKKVVAPRNRQAFKIALKKLNTTCESKKEGTRRLRDVKEQKELFKTNRKKENKRQQNLKRLLKTVNFSHPNLPNKQKEAELKLNYPKVYKKFQQLVG